MIKKFIQKEQRKISQNKLFKTICKVNITQKAVPLFHILNKIPNHHTQYKAKRTFIGHHFLEQENSHPKKKVAKFRLIKRNIK